MLMKKFFGLLVLICLTIGMSTVALASEREVEPNRQSHINMLQAALDGITVDAARSNARAREGIDLSDDAERFFFLKELMAPVTATWHYIAEAVLASFPCLESRLNRILMEPIVIEHEYLGAIEFMLEGCDFTVSAGMRRTSEFHLLEEFIAQVLEFEDETAAIARFETIIGDETWSAFDPWGRPGFIATYSSRATWQRQFNGVITFIGVPSAWFAINIPSMVSNMTNTFNSVSNNGTTFAFAASAFRIYHISPEGVMSGASNRSISFP